MLWGLLSVGAAGGCHPATVLRGLLYAGGPGKVLSNSTRTGGSE